MPDALELQFAQAEASELHNALDCLEVYSGTTSMSSASSQDSCSGSDELLPPRNHEARKNGWQFNPAGEMLADKSYRNSSGMSSRTQKGTGRCSRSSRSSSNPPSPSREHTELPPLLAHLAGDAVALRQWASVAVAELAALKLGERHVQLQLAGLANENERLERALGDALHDKRTAEESVQLLRAKGDASDVALPLLRGQLLDAASSRATAAERQAAASQRETARVSAALAEAQRKATAEVTGLRSEVEALSGQLAQRAVLYSAQERRWRAEGHDLSRATLHGLREAAQYEGEISALKYQVSQLQAQVATANQHQARAEDGAQLAAQQSAAAVRRANEAEANAGGAASERDALRSEVARLRQGDVGELEATWSAQLEQLQRRFDQERRESKTAAEQQASKHEALTQSLREAQQQLAAWQSEATRTRQEATSAKRALEGYASQGTDGAVNKLLGELQATQAELRELRKSHQQQQPREQREPSIRGPLTPLPPASAVGKSTGSAAGVRGGGGAATAGNGGGVSGRPATTALARGAEASQSQWTEVSVLSQSQSQSQVPQELRQDHTLDTAQMRGEIFGGGGAISAGAHAAASSVTPPPQPEPHVPLPTSSSSGSGATNTHEANQAAEAWRARTTAAESALAAARSEAASLVASYQKLQEEVEHLRWADGEARRVIGAWQERLAQAEASLSRSRERCAHAETVAARLAAAAKAHARAPPPPETSQLAPAPAPPQAQAQQSAPPYVQQQQSPTQLQPSAAASASTRPEPPAATSPVVFREAPCDNSSSSNNHSSNHSSSTESKTEGSSDAVEVQAARLRDFVASTKDGDALRRAALWALDANLQLARQRREDEAALIAAAASQGNSSHDGEREVLVSEEGIESAVEASATCTEHTETLDGEGGAPAKDVQSAEGSADEEKVITAMVDAAVATDFTEEDLEDAQSARAEMAAAEVRAVQWQSTATALRAELEALQLAAAAAHQGSSEACKTTAAPESAAVVAAAAGVAHASSKEYEVAVLSSAASHALALTLGTAPAAPPGVWLEERRSLEAELNATKQALEVLQAEQVANTIGDPSYSREDNDDAGTGGRGGGSDEKSSGGSSISNQANIALSPSHDANALLEAQTQLTVVEKQLAEALEAQRVALVEAAAARDEAKAELAVAEEFMAEARKVANAAAADVPEARRLKSESDATSDRRTPKNAGDDPGSELRSNGVPVSAEAKAMAEEEPLSRDSLDAAPSDQNAPSPEAREEATVAVPAVRSTAENGDEELADNSALNSAAQIAAEKEAMAAEKAELQEQLCASESRLEEAADALRAASSASELWQARLDEAEERASAAATRQERAESELASIQVELEEAQGALDVALNDAAKEREASAIAAQKYAEQLKQQLEAEAAARQRVAVSEAVAKAEAALELRVREAVGAELATELASQAAEHDARTMELESEWQQRAASEQQAAIEAALLEARAQAAEDTAVKVNLAKEEAQGALNAALAGAAQAHAEQVESLEAHWLNERQRLMQQCESILNKTQQATERLKRQQELQRSSRDTRDSLRGSGGMPWTSGGGTRGSGESPDNHATRGGGHGGGGSSGSDGSGEGQTTASATAVPAAPTTTTTAVMPEAWGRPPRPPHQPVASVSPARAATQRAATTASKSSAAPEVGAAGGEPRANSPNRLSRNSLAESTESNTTWGDEEEAKVEAQLNGTGGSIDPRRSSAEGKSSVDNLLKAGSGQDMIVHTLQQPARRSRRYG